MIFIYIYIRTITKNLNSIGRKAVYTFRMFLTYFDADLDRSLSLDIIFFKTIQKQHKSIQSFNYRMWASLYDLRVTPGPKVPKLCPTACMLLGSFTVIALDIIYIPYSTTVIDMVICV